MKCAQLAQKTAQYNSIQYIIDSPKDLTPETLEKLRRAKIQNYRIIDDVSENYSLQDMQDILEVMDRIKNATLDLTQLGLSKRQIELIKFFSAYIAIGMHNYIGLDCEIIFGATTILQVDGQEYPDMQDMPHAWNQVKIDGKWYNCDLTWDYSFLRDIMNGDNFTNLYDTLKSDSDFMIHYTNEEVNRRYLDTINDFPDGVPLLEGRNYKPHKCDETISKEEMKEILTLLRDGIDTLNRDNANGDEIDLLTPNLDEGIVSREDFQGIAYSTVITPKFAERFNNVNKTRFKDKEH